MPEIGCPQPQLDDLVAAIRRDEAQGLNRLGALLEEYPRDARLHFLQGSVLAGQQRYAEAHEAIAKAVALAPELWVARFQLGFLELTSGDPGAAEATWAPFERLPQDYYLSLFVHGLRRLMRDEFPETIRLLGAGIQRNVDNPAMNHDMQLIIDTLQVAGPPPDAEAEPVSAAQLLLRQYAGKTRH
jgi:tetratricopeptide (TPR) repeat protein